MSPWVARLKHSRVAFDGAGRFLSDHVGCMSCLAPMKRATNLMHTVSGPSPGRGLLSLPRSRMAVELPANEAPIERAEREPGLRTVYKLARALGLPPAELFEGLD